MELYDIRKLALIFAVQAEIEGMKAFNLIRDPNGIGLPYDENAFFVKAEELRNLAYKCNE